MKKIAFVLGCMVFLFFACKKDVPEPPSAAAPSQTPADTTSTDTTGNGNTPSPRPHYIIAGDTISSAVLYTSFNPVRTYYTHMVPPLSDIPVDMDNDGTTDFTIHEKESHSLGCGWLQEESNIISNGGWQVVRDPANPSYIKVFSQNDSINANNQWSPLDTTIRIAYFNSIGMPCTPSQTVINTNLSNVYIGLRKQTGSDTLYAWLKIGVTLSPNPGAELTTRLYSSGVLR